MGDVVLTCIYLSTRVLSGQGGKVSRFGKLFTDFVIAITCEADVESRDTPVATIARANPSPLIRAAMRAGDLLDKDRRGFGPVGTHELAGFLDLLATSLGFAVGCGREVVGIAFGLRTLVSLVERVRAFTPCLLTRVVAGVEVDAFLVGHGSGFQTGKPSVRLHLAQSRRVERPL